MLIIFRFFLSFTLVFFLPGLSDIQAQEAVPNQKANGAKERVHTLRQALEQAFKNNPGLRAERAAVRARIEEYPQALSNFLPSLTLDASFDANNVRGDGINNANDGTAEKELGLSISQPIYRGGRSKAELNEAINNISAQKAELNQEEQELFIEVIDAYLDLIQNRQALEINLNNEKILRQRFENSQARFDAGEATISDVSQSQTFLADALADVQEAEDDLNETRETFINLVGMPPAETLAPPILGIALPAEFIEIEQFALKNNPEILEAHFDLKAAQEGIKIEVGGLLPEVNMTASYKNEYDPAPGNNDLRREQRFLIRARMPIFQAGEQRSEIREAKQSANELQLQLDNKIREIKRDVADSWKRYKSAKKIIEFRKQQVTAAQKARGSIFLEVEAGERTFIDLLEADQDVLDAELSLTISKSRASSARYSLFELMGALNASVVLSGFDPGIKTPDQYLEDVKWSVLSVHPYLDSHPDLNVAPGSLNGYQDTSLKAQGIEDKTQKNTSKWFIKVTLPDDTYTIHSTSLDLSDFGPIQITSREKTETEDTKFPETKIVADILVGPFKSEFEANIVLDEILDKGIENATLVQ